MGELCSAHGVCDLLHSTNDRRLQSKLTNRVDEELALGYIEC